HLLSLFSFFLLHATSPTSLHTLSLHDALPILPLPSKFQTVFLASTLPLVKCPLWFFRVSTTSSAICNFGKLRKSSYSRLWTEISPRFLKLNSFQSVASRRA